jgi:hypothetical protein
MPSPLPIKIS